MGSFHLDAQIDAQIPISRDDAMGPISREATLETMRYALGISILLILPCASQAARGRALRQADGGAGLAQGAAPNSLPPRRLSDAAKSTLAACLKKSPGEFSIAAIANHREAYRYALDWREVFLAAGWHGENGNTLIKVFTIAGGRWTGMRVSMHGDPEHGEAAGDNSPEAGLARCVEARRDIPAGGRILRYKERRAGGVAIQVSTEPQPRR